MLYELKCTNEDCGLEYEDQIKLAEIEEKGATCPDCGSPAVREIRSNPTHSRHASAAAWRMGHGY